MKVAKTAALVVLALALTPACGDEEDPMVTPEDSTSDQTIPEVATAAGSFTTLLNAVETAGLAETLASEGQFTVFAPTDAAFEAFEADNPGALDALSPAQLADVLKFHVVSGRITASGLANGEVPTLLEGQSLTVDLTGGVTVEGVTVTMPDILASNGVIHVIDYVLLPPAAD